MHPAQVVLCTLAGLWLIGLGSCRLWLPRLLPPPRRPDVWQRGRPPQPAPNSDRAQRLLARLLTDQQRQTFRRGGMLVVGSPGIRGREYAIPNHPGRVQVWQTEGYGRRRLTGTLCVGPDYQLQRDGSMTDQLPWADVMLCHKLLIEGDEQAYLRTACFTQHSGVCVYL